LPHILAAAHRTRRPENEKVYLLMPVGYAAEKATVPYRVRARKADAELFSTF
jgi:hypothetical protein